MAIIMLAAYKAVTIGSGNWASSTTVLGLYANHAYAIVGYNASTDKFTLYNPWGCDQPDPLSWSPTPNGPRTQMAITGTSGTVPIAGAAVRAGLVRLSASLVHAAMASDNLL